MPFYLYVMTKNKATNKYIQANTTCIVTAVWEKGGQAPDTPDICRVSEKSLHVPRTPCPGHIFKSSSNDCNELNFFYKHLHSVKIYHFKNFITCLKTLQNYDIILRPKQPRTHVRGKYENKSAHAPDCYGKCPGRPPIKDKQKETELETAPNIFLMCEMWN